MQVSSAPPRVSTMTKCIGVAVGVLATVVAALVVSASPG